MPAYIEAPATHSYTDTVLSTLSSQTYLANHIFMNLRPFWELFVFISNGFHPFLHYLHYQVCPVCSCSITEDPDMYVGCAPHLLFCLLRVKQLPHTLNTPK